MSKVKNALLAAGITIFSCTAGAQTIEELTAAARQAKQRSFQDAAGTAGAPLPSISSPGASQAVVRIPLTEAIGEVPTPKKRKFDDEPYLLSIYGVGTRLISEIAEEGVAAKYRPGQKTLTGWTVATIAKTYVDLEKHDKRGKVTARKRLAFWRELDSPDEQASTPAARRPTGPISPFNPPLPPTVTAR